MIPMQVMESLYQQDQEHVKVISSAATSAKRAGLAAGFHQAEGEIIFTLDADLQDDPNEMHKFIEKLDEGYDFITGWKYRPSRPTLQNACPPSWPTAPSA